MDPSGDGLASFEVEVLETVEIQRVSRYRTRATSKEVAKREFQFRGPLPSPEHRGEPEEVDILHREVVGVRVIDEEAT